MIFCGTEADPLSVMIAVDKYAGLDLMLIMTATTISASWFQGRWVDILITRSWLSLCFHSHRTDVVLDAC